MHVPNLSLVVSGCEMGPYEQQEIAKNARTAKIAEIGNSNPFTYQGSHGIEIIDKSCVLFGVRYQAVERRFVLFLPDSLGTFHPLHRWDPANRGTRHRLDRRGGAEGFLFPLFRHGKRDLTTKGGKAAIPFSGGGVSMSDFGRIPCAGMGTTGCTGMFRLRRRMRSDSAQHDSGGICILHLRLYLGRCDRDLKASAANNQTGCRVFQTLLSPDSRLWLLCTQWTSAIFLTRRKPRSRTP
jgi:hypothetical protein